MIIKVCVVALMGMNTVARFDTGYTAEVWDTLSLPYLRHIKVVQCILFVHLYCSWKDCKDCNNAENQAHREYHYPDQCEHPTCPL